jgi:hypothetical protein
MTDQANSTSQELKAQATSKSNKNWSKLVILGVIAVLLLIIFWVVGNNKVFKINKDSIEQQPDSSGQTPELFDQAIAKFPIYPGAVLIAAEEREGEFPRASWTWEIEESPDAVMEWYKQKQKFTESSGWKIKELIDIEDGGERYLGLSNPPWSYYVSIEVADSPDKTNMIVKLEYRPPIKTTNDKY